MSAKGRVLVAGREWGEKRHNERHYKSVIVTKLCREIKNISE